MDLLVSLTQKQDRFRARIAELERTTPARVMEAEASETEARRLDLIESKDAKAGKDLAEKKRAEAQAARDELRQLKDDVNVKYFSHALGKDVSQGLGKDFSHSLTGLISALLS